MQIPTRSSLRPQTLDRINRLNRWYQKPMAQVSTALLFTVVTITFFAFVAIRPTLTTITQLVRKIEDQRSVKAQLDQKVAALATAESEFALARPYLTDINQAVPISTEIDSVLKQIEASANSNQAPLQGISLSGVTLGHDSSLETTSAIAIPININLGSNFTNLAAFLDTITSNKRILTLESIFFSPPSSLDSETIDLIVKMNAYYYPE